MSASFSGNRSIFPAQEYLKREANHLQRLKDAVEKRDVEKIRSVLEEYPLFGTLYYGKTFEEKKELVDLLLTASRMIEQKYPQYHEGLKELKPGDVILTRDNTRISKWLRFWQSAFPGRKASTSHIAIYLENGWMISAYGWPYDRIVLEHVKKLADKGKFTVKVLRLKGEHGEINRETLRNFLTEAVGKRYASFLFTFGQVLGRRTRKHLSHAEKHTCGTLAAEALQESTGKRFDIGAHWPRDFEHSSLFNPVTQFSGRNHKRR